MIKFLPIMLAVLLVVALGLLVRAIAWAFKGEEEALVDHAELRALQIEKDRAVENLRDLEFDLQLKKISDEDYEAMKGPAQLRALDAIRALDEASRKMVLGLALILCSVMALPQSGWAMPGMESAKGKSGLRQMSYVQVSMLQENGERVPAPGVSVLLEAHVKKIGPSNRQERVGEAVVLTNGRGEINHPWTLPAGASVTATAEWKGTTFPGELGTDGIFIDVYSVTEDRSELELEPRAILSMREGLIWVQGEWLLSHSLNSGVKSGAEGINLPLISPIVFGRVLNGEWMPKQADRHMKLSTDSGGGAVRLQDGILNFVGVVPPGPPIKIRFEYPIDVVEHTMDLGVSSSDLPMKRVMVAFTSPQELQPSIRMLASKSRGLQETRRGDRTVLQWTVHPPALREEVKFRLTKLPYEGDLSRQVAASVVGLVGMLFVLGLIRVFFLQRYSGISRPESS